jgi:hypothetical protein
MILCRVWVFVLFRWLVTATVVPCLLHGVLLLQTKHHRSMSFLISILYLSSRLDYHLNSPSMYCFGVLPAFISVLCYFTFFFKDTTGRTQPTHSHHTHTQACASVHTKRKRLGGSSLQCVGNAQYHWTRMRVCTLLFLEKIPCWNDCSKYYLPQHNLGK